MATRLTGRVGRPVHLDIVPPDAEVTVTEKTKSVKKEKVTIVGDETTRETEMSPQFMQQLLPVVDAAIGSNVKLECQVDGMPEPQITWLFNGQPISPSKRRQLTYANRWCTLTIFGVGRMDSGDYICRAINALGDVTTKCTVRIGNQPVNGVPQQVAQPGFPPPQIDGSPIVPQVTPSAQSRPGDLAPEVPPAPLTEPCAVIPLQPGQVPHMPLGATLQLDIGGTGATGVIQQSNSYQQQGMQITQNTAYQQSSAFQQSATYQSASFQQQSFSSTQQQYQQQQQIHTGLTTSSTSSYVRRETHSGRSTPIRVSSRQTTPVRSGRSTPVRSGRSTPTFQEPPRFTMPLRDLTINDGDRVVFKVMWRGIPRPTLNWYFNSEPIIPSDDFQIKIDINRGESVLIIKEVFPDDEGEYMCKAESPLGAAVTHCHLFVRLPSSSEEDIEKLVSRTEDVVRLQESLHLKERSSFSETISIDTQKRFKEFQMQFQIPDRRAERSEILMRQQAALRGMKMHVDVELPTPRTQVETKTMHLQKTVDVKPAMHKQLAYLKLPLAQQRRFSETIAIDQSKPRQEPVQVTFSLPEQRRRLEKSAIQIRQQAALRGMKMEVEIAENQRQTAKCMHTTKKHAHAISTQRQEFHLQLEGAPPHFTVDLTSAKVMDGEEVKFNATVVGNPMPEVTWYKNGKVIVENPDFHTTYDKKTGICTLHILEVFPQDTGEYRCIAVNQYGRAVTGATLQVDVFEYVPDSEEASASAAESLPDRQVSEDEAEFLERTQAFIANMQKLRQELQEEQVREEEVVMTEEYNEETVQMADVKWQIPKKAVTLEIQMAEQTTVDVPEEKTEITQEKHIEFVLATPQVESQPQMQVQHTDLIYHSEIVMEQPSPPSPEAPVEEDIVPDLKQPVKAPTKEVHVQPQVEHTAEEFSSEFHAEITTEMTDGQQVEVELVQHNIEARKESLAMPLEEHLLPEIVQESMERVPSPEETQPMHVEVALEQHEVQQAEESMVTQLEEVTQAEIVQEDVARVPSPEESKEEHVTVELSQHLVQEAKESLVMPQEELLQPENVEESAERVPSPEASQEQHVQVELAQHVVEQAKQSLVQPQEELLHPEIVEESAERIPTPEGAGEEHVQVELSVMTKEEAKQSLVQPTEEVTEPEMVEEVQEGIPAAEGAGEEQVVVEMAVQITEEAKGSMVAPLEEVTMPEMVEEVARGPSPEGAGEEQVIVEMAIQITEEAKGSMVAPLEEVTMPEMVEEVARGPSPEGAGEEHVTVEMATQITEEAKGSMVAPLEEVTMPEMVEDAERIPTPEGAGEEHVMVEMALQVTEEAKGSMVTPLEEVTMPEMVEEAERVPTPEGAGEEHVIVEMAVQTTEEAKASMVTPLEEVTLPEMVEESGDRIPSPEGAGQQQVEVQLSMQVTEDAKASLVTPLEEVTHPEMVVESQERVPTPEGAIEEDVYADVDRAWTVDAEGSMVMPQAEMVQPEETLESEARVPTPEGAGEEQVTVDLGQSVVEAAQGSLVMPQEEVLPPEVVEESKERVPTPEGAGQEQVKVDLSKHAVEAAKGSMVMTQEERLKEEDIMDLLDRMPSPVDTEGQEVVVPLDMPAVESAKEHYTGMVEERHSEEEEEDIYFEAPEPELKGEEVHVDLGSVLVQEREMLLTETQFAQIEAIETGEANADYDEEDTRKEQVIVPLEQARKELAKPSLVGMQEQVVPPIQAEEMNLEPPIEETTEGKKVEVPLDKAAAQAAKGSLVGQTEDIVEVQTIKEDIEELHEEFSHGDQVHVRMDSAWKMHRPLQLAGPVIEKVQPERPGAQYDDSIKEMRMIPTYVQPEYEPAVLEWFRLEIRVAPRGLEDDEMISDEAYTEHMSMEQIQSQYQMDQQSMQASISAQQRQFQTDMQHLEWRSEAASEAHMEFRAQEVQQRTEQQSQLMAASIESRVVRAAQEVTEEREVVTETTREEIEVIKRPIVEEMVEEEPQDRVRSGIKKHPLMAPVFEMPLSDITVADGERAVLECKVTGVPRPEVYWYVDQMEIKITAEFRIEYTIEGYVRLYISDVLQEDEGEYTVKAVNQAGTCTSSAYLTVLPPERSEPASPMVESQVSMQQQMMTQEQVISETFRKMEVDISMQTRKEMSIVEVPIPVQHEGPRFIRNLEHKEIFESMEVTMECHVTGNPEPEIAWYQDGKKLTSTEHIELMYNKGVCKLHIPQVTIQDEAEYMCEARNEYGLASTVAELLVERRKEETQMSSTTVVTQQVQQTTRTDIQVAKKETLDMSQTHHRAIQQVVHEQAETHHSVVELPVDAAPQETQQSVLAIGPKEQPLEYSQYSTTMQIQVQGKTKHQEITFEVPKPQEQVTTVLQVMTPTKKVVTKKEVTRIKDSHVAEVAVPLRPLQQKRLEKVMSKQQMQLTQAPEEQPTETAVVEFPVEQTLPSEHETHSTTMTMEVRGRRRRSEVTLEIPLPQMMQVHTTATTEVTREITAQEPTHMSGEEGMHEEVTETVTTKYETVITGELQGPEQTVPLQMPQQHVLQQGQEQHKSSYYQQQVLLQQGAPTMKEITMEIPAESLATTQEITMVMPTQDVSQETLQHTTTVVRDVQGTAKLEEVTLDIPMAPEGTRTQAAHHAKFVEEEVKYTPVEEMHSSEMLLDIHGQGPKLPEEVTLQFQLPEGGTQQIIQAMDIKSDSEDGFMTPSEELPDELKPQLEAFTEMAEQVSAQLRAEFLPSIAHHAEVTTKEIGQIYVGGRKISLQATVKTEERVEPKAPKEEPKKVPEKKEAPKVPEKPKKKPEPEKPVEQKPAPVEPEEEEIVIDENLPAWKKQLLQSKKDKIERRKSLKEEERRKSLTEQTPKPEEQKPVEEKPVEQKPTEEKPDDKMPAWKKLALERRKSKELPQPKEEAKPETPKKAEEKPKEAPAPEIDENIPAWKRAIMERRKSSIKEDEPKEEPKKPEESKKPEEKPKPETKAPQPEEVTQEETKVVSYKKTTTVGEIEVGGRRISLQAILTPQDIQRLVEESSTTMVVARPEDIKQVQLTTTPQKQVAQVHEITVSKQKRRLPRTIKEEPKPGDKFTKTAEVLIPDLPGDRGPHEVIPLTFGPTEVVEVLQPATIEVTKEQPEVVLGGRRLSLTTSDQAETIKTTTKMTTTVQTAEVGEITLQGRRISLQAIVTEKADDKPKEEVKKAPVEKVDESIPAWKRAVLERRKSKEEPQRKPSIPEEKPEEKPKAPEVTEITEIVIGGKTVNLKPEEAKPEEVKPDRPRKSSLKQGKPMQPKEVTFEIPQELATAELGEFVYGGKRVSLTAVVLPEEAPQPEIMLAPVPEQHFEVRTIVQQQPTTIQQVTKTQMMSTVTTQEQTPQRVETTQEITQQLPTELSPMEIGTYRYK